ncbi:MAG: Gfo/Idh/MocA family oxidoreductase [Rhodospirillales bacterium]
MTLRLAGIGAGYFSRFHYRAWRRLEEIEIVAICDRSLDQAERCARDLGVAAVFDDPVTMLQTVKPDIVDIITPPEAHLRLIELAAAHRVNVICQKPFCRDLGEALEAVALAERAGIKLLVHENFRFQPWYEKIKQVIQSGELGDIFQATFRLRPGDGQGQSAYLERQPYFRQMPRLLIHETAIHLIDVFRYLFGSPENVYASLRRLNPHIAGEDAGIVIVQMANGVQAVFDGNRLSDHQASNRRLTMGEFTVEGAKATLMLNGDGEILLRRHGANEVRRVDYDWSDVDFGGDCVYRFQRHAVDAMLSRSAPQTLALDYVENLRIEEAIYRSHETGGKIKL